MGNIELPEEVVSVLDHGGEGIGLYRTEFQYLSRPDFPSEFELYDKYKDVVDVMGQRPVIIRTLDINGDKALAFNHDAEEANPALGMRAIRYCLQKPEVFLTQLRAILRAAVHGNVRLLLPLISSCEEVLRSIMLLDQAAESLEKEGIDYRRDIQVGVMIEVPSAVVMADVLAEMVDFFSIGTNDLIQYTLGVDRSNERVSYLYRPLDPAIIRLIRHVVQVAREAKIPLLVCGEMAGDPLLALLLVGLGVRALSMNPAAVPAVRRVVRGGRYDEARRLARRVLRLPTTEEIEDEVNEFMSELYPDETFASFSVIE
jgi:phosphotransferase system enzyme I (PtsI)